MPKLIDDFTTGPCAMTTVGPPQLIQYQAGSMLGGGRMLVLTNTFNPRHTPATLAAGDADRLNLTLGPKGFVGVQIAYGYLPDGSPEVGKAAYLGANLHEWGTALRTNFECVSGAVGTSLSFNVLIYTEHGWSQGTKHATPSDMPFSHDIPFSSFVGPGGQDFHDVDIIVLLFDVHGDLAINSIEIV